MSSKHQFVICIDNTDYVVSLEKRKIYECIPDDMAEKHNQIRVVDESGEDYLYPSHFFLSVDLPETVEKALLIAA